MAMGIVSNKEFDSELGSLNPNKIEKRIPIEGRIEDVTRGRPSGAIEVPNTLRRIIGDESTINGRQSAIELAQKFGVSPSSVSAYNVGATSTSSYNERPNALAISGARERISKRARSKLMAALHHITNDKLEVAKARDLAGIAKDMSAVVRNMEPEGPKAPTVNGPTFVFYSPQLRKEENFEVIHTKE